MTKMFRFKSLKQTTEARQKEILIKPGRTEESRRKYEELLEQSQSMVITPKDVVNYLIYVGLDYKGQIQMAFETKGWGGSSEVSVNPLGLVGLNTELSIGGSVKRAKQRVIIVSKGPSSINFKNNHKIPMPIVVNSLVGKYWEGKTQIGIDVSVGFEAAAGVTPKRGSAQAAAETSSSIDKNFGKKDNSPGLTGFEAVGVSASAKAGLKAEAGYTYDHFYAEDVYPLYFDKQDEVKKKLEKILSEGSIRGMFKYDACSFINDHVRFFGNKKLNLHGKFLWHTTTKGYKDIIKRLNNCSPNAPENIKSEAEIYKDKLNHFSTKGDATTYLRLSSHKAEGQAGVYAKAEASAAAGGLVSLGVNAELFAGVSGSYKKAYSRFQSKTVTESYKRGEKIRPQTVFTTYDTTIMYSSFYLGLDADIDVSGNISSYGKSLKDDTAFGESLEEAMEKAKWRPDSLNQISYRTAIAYWRKPDPLSESRRPVPPGTIKKRKARSCQGTGVAFGQSFVVGNLKKLITNYYNESTGKFNRKIKNDPYIKIIAHALNIPFKDIRYIIRFLRNKDVLSNIAYYLPLDVGILIEATHKPVNLPRLIVNQKIDKKTGKEFVQLAPDFSKTLFKEKLKLESIRLRYRRRDVSDKDSSLFTIGFKVQGTGAKIRLEKVQRAGADGIFDVTTVFVNDELKRLHDGQNPAAAYEKAVPPAALFCQ